LYNTAVVTRWLRSELRLDKLNTQNWPTLVS